MPKRVYQCENCEAVHKMEKTIKTCPVCHFDVCSKCKDRCSCSITREIGHKACFVKECGEFYKPSVWGERKCEVCNLIDCDCEDV